MKRLMLSQFGPAWGGGGVTGLTINVSSLSSLPAFSLAPLQVSLWMVSFSHIWYSRLLGFVCWRTCGPDVSSLCL